MQERSNEDLYNPIDLNHIFNDDDILDEWIREGEEPILSSDNLDWLDQDPSREGRETTRDDDGSTSYKVSRRASSIAQGRDIGSSRKGKTPRIIFSNSSSDDSDDEVSSRGGSNISGNSEDSEDTSGDNGVGGGIGASGRGNENYYATQDTDHGYRLGIWEQ